MFKCDQMISKVFSNKKIKHVFEKHHTVYRGPCQELRDRRALEKLSYDGFPAQFPTAYVAAGFPITIQNISSKKPV